MGEEAVELRHGLIDLTEPSLADLDRVGESVLDHALRRLLDEENSGPVAGFDASI